MKIIIVDDHELILYGTVQLLRQHYPHSQISTSTTATDVKKLLNTSERPDLLIVDLSIPEKKGGVAKIEYGIELLLFVMKKYANMNICVLSSTVKVLNRIISQINDYHGGFVIVDKALSSDEFIRRIELAIVGATYIKDLQEQVLSIKQEWLTVLKLAYNESLQDSEIAKRMNTSLSNVRNYMSKVQCAMDVYPNEGVNLRLETYRVARELGLVD